MQPDLFCICWKCFISFTMRSSYAIRFPILAASYLSLVSAAITADPTITQAPNVPLELLRKQNNNRFMGWLSYRGTWSSVQCEYGGTLYQNGEYWGCCTTAAASCNRPIGCLSGSLVYTFTSGTISRATYGCTDIYTDSTDRSFTVCNTGYLYENTQDTSPETNLFCGVSSLNWSYYRVLPEVSSETSSFSSSSSPRSTSASSTSSPATTSATPTPTAASSQEKSKAWIAGAVVGPIGGLALVGAIFWFCFVRRKKRASPPPPPPVAQQPPHSNTPTYFTGSPQSPSSQPYGSPQAQQQGDFVPCGVTKHESWQGSQSPNQPASPYGPLSSSPPPQQQQWQPMQQPSSPQMMGTHTPYQQPYGVGTGMPAQQNAEAPRIETHTPSPRPFSNDMYAGNMQHQPPR
ncbi:hypothetical protein EJ04DRAFT_578958 [Polyplosphaeria fusca]|uniref:Uncharacterized protein n=1 Tax=Polyplosphaeria fusca TaxID=682080 RepID=A0A9P4QV73_9PLEO|nr:hypothetical protein EJ04DRAFT_578958 [Polyplosphaeria fusca]